jgi:hypothetical protein
MNFRHFSFAAWLLFMRIPNCPRQGVNSQCCQPNDIKNSEGLCAATNRKAIQSKCCQITQIAVSGARFSNLRLINDATVQSITAFSAFHEFIPDTEIVEAVSHKPNNVCFDNRVTRSTLRGLKKTPVFRYTNRR